MAEKFNVWKWAFEIARGMQYRVAELCYCFSLYSRAHHFKFPLVSWKSGLVTGILEKMPSPCSFWELLLPSILSHLILICKFKASRCNDTRFAWSLHCALICLKATTDEKEWHPHETCCACQIIDHRFDHNSQSNIRYGLSCHHLSPAVILS